jgi:antitoxin component YwqK of YwqJK toxin-antitoxin module
MIKKIISLSYILLFVSGIVFSQLPTDTINKTDKTGKKTGFWIKKYENGKIRYQGRFENDKPIGEFTYFYEDGNLKAISIFKDKGIRSFTKTYSPDGKIMSEGYYLNEKKDSAWKYFNDYNIVIKEEFYRNYQKHGEWKTYFAEGSLTDKITYKNGKRDGVWEQNYIGGSLKTQFVNDKLEGLYRVYTFEGKLRNQGKYKNNKKEGNWIWYDKNGIPTKKYIYKDNRLLRKELMVYENKKLIEINFDSIAYIYQTGAIIYLKKFDNTLFKLNEKLTFYIDLLDVDNFIPINKNFFANMKSIKSIKSYDEKYLKVKLTPTTDFEVISEEESTKAINNLFNANK